MSLKISGGPFKFPGRLNLTYLTAQTAVVRVVTPRNVNIAYIIFYSASCVTMSNSLFNPIIYCVRMRQFRVAFIQMLLRKSYAQAEQFERQMFGSLNIEASQEAGPP